MTKTDITDIKEQTRLPGPWKEIKVICPKCKDDGKNNPDEFVYIYDDKKTCYCCQCNLEFNLLDLDTTTDYTSDKDEDLEIKQKMELDSKLDEMVTDDPKTVSELADRILNTVCKECHVSNGHTKDCKSQIPDCDCGGKNGCHFVACPKSPVRTDQSGYVDPECPHGWHWISNCPVCKKYAMKEGDKSQKQLPAYQHKSWDGVGYSKGYINSCTHTPQHIIDGEGWGVWAGKKEDCRNRAKEFDIVLNLTFTSIKEPHIIPIPELAEFEEYNCQFKEIQLDWPDYGVVNLPLDFWVKLLKHLEQNKLRMLVFCLGGHGRTGTALAIMMCLSLGYTPKKAINWINRHYCHEAVETVNQEQYVDKMYQEYKKLIKEEKPEVNQNLEQELEKEKTLHQEAVEYINKMNKKDKTKKLKSQSAKAGKE